MQLFGFSRMCEGFWISYWGSSDVSDEVAVLGCFAACWSRGGVRSQDVCGVLVYYATCWEWWEVLGNGRHSVPDREDRTDGLGGLDCDA